MPVKPEHKADVIDFYEDFAEKNAGMSLPEVQGKEPVKTTKEYLSKSSVDKEPKLFNDDEMGEQFNDGSGLTYLVEVTCKIKADVEGAKPYTVPMICGATVPERVLEQIKLAASSERFKVVLQAIVGEQM